MDKAFIKMLKDFKSHKANEVYEIDSATADLWIEAGIAEKTVAPEADIAERISKTLEQKLDERDEKILKAFAKVESKTPSIRLVESEADKKACLGEMIQLVAKAHPSNGNDSERAEAKKTLAEVYKSTMQVGSAVLGGYTVPTQYVNQLIENPGIPSAFLDRTTKVPVNSEGEVELPALDQSGTPDGKGETSANAGVKVYHGNELDDTTEEDFRFKMVKFRSDRLMAFIPFTNHLLRSSALGVQAIGQQLLVNALKDQKEYDCLLGDGVGKALGALESACAISVTRATASRVKYEDVRKMWNKMHPKRRANAIWLYSIDVEPELLALEDGNGNSVFHPTAQASPNMQLFGNAAFPCEFLPALGTAKDIIFVDPTAYYTVEGLAPTLSVSDQVRWLKDQTLIKVENWFGGQSAFNAKTILGNGTTEVSPTVYLT